MKTILIVDDSEIQLKLVTGFLKSDERKIITARNGIEGLNQAISFRPDLKYARFQHPPFLFFPLLLLLSAVSKKNLDPEQSYAKSMSEEKYNFFFMRVIKNFLE